MHIFQCSNHNNKLAGGAELSVEGHFYVFRRLVPHENVNKVRITL